RPSQFLAFSDGEYVMRFETSLQHRMNQVMALAPRMIHSMEILQLPIMALQERIQQELDENPVIELRDVEEKPAAEGEEATAPDQSAAEETFEAPEKELVIEDSDTNELDFDRLDALSKDWEDAFNEDHKPSRNGIEEEGDKKHDAMQNMASRPQSLQEYLADQLGYLDITPEQAQLVRHVI